MPAFLGQKDEIAPVWRSVGRSLFGMSLVFLFANVVGSIQNHSLPDPPQALIQFRLSSQFTFVGLFLMFCNRKGALSEKEVFSHFTRGLFGATCIVAIYILTQYVTGYDYRPGSAFRPDRLLVNGFYRVSGMQGHPSSLAALALGIFCFSWALVWSSMKAWTTRHEFKMWIAIAALHGLFIMLTGSRIVAVVFALFLFAIPLSRLAKTIEAKRLALLAAGAVLGFAVLVYLSGLGGRFIEAWQRVQSGVVIDDRLYFWKAYWHLITERPFFGHGTAFLNQDLLNRTYQDIGLGEISRKYDAHNLYLELLANVGIVGAAIMAFLTYKVGHGISIVAGFSPRLKVFTKALVCSASANFIFGLTQNTFFDSSVSVFYCSMIMVMFWMSESRKTHPSQEM